MSKRTLTKEEKQIKALQKNLPCMKNAVGFLNSLKKAKGLRRVEETIYELYFHYSVETENQDTGMTYETGGNRHLVSRKATELRTFAKAFNAMTEDEKLAVLIQLFPKDFEFDNEECIIGFESNDEDNEDEAPLLKASVRKLNHAYSYV